MRTRWNQEIFSVLMERDSQHSIAFHRFARFVLPQNFSCLNAALPGKLSPTRAPDPEDPRRKAPLLRKTDIRKREQQPQRLKSSPSIHSPSLISHILQESVMFFTGSVSTNTGLWKMWRGRRERWCCSSLGRDKCLAMQSCTWAGTSP